MDDYTPRKTKDHYPTQEVSYADVVDDYEYAWPPPRYITSGSHHSSIPPVVKPGSHARAMEYDYDEENYHSQNPPSIAKSGSRIRVTNDGYNAPSHHSNVPPSVVKSIPRGRTSDYGYDEQSHHSQIPPSVVKSTPRGRAVDDDYGEPSYRSTIPPSVAKSVDRSRAVDDGYDGRSRHSSRYNGSRAASLRSRSETLMERVPLPPIEVDQMSYAPSRHSGAPRSVYDYARSRVSGYEPDRESFFSARSQRSAATARPPPSESRPPPVEYDLLYRSRAGSRASTTKGSASGGHHSTRRHRSSSRGPSQYSAKEVPLPMSDVGSSHANWDDDLDSVAPDDSISCVGSKSSRRSRRRH